MMEDWSTALAREIKSRDNQPVIGAVLGIVVTPPPDLKISILEGQAFITEVYVLDYVLTDYKRKITLPFESVSGEITIQPYETTREEKKLLEPKDYKINVFELRDKEAVTVDTLKQGDEVLLVSSMDNQKYFCLGRVTKVGG